MIVDGLPVRDLPLEGPRDASIRCGRVGHQLQGEHLFLLAPEQCEIELIGKHFGGGEYRAKLLGLWDPQRRQEEYLEQVTFALCDRAWPITAETLARLREQQLK